MNYRSDIDGLRTIAVLLVVFNHAGFSFFSGGFVGVDVFFVISGFLITSIIYPRIQDKTFSFGWFFSRRIKRLMPILFFVIFVSIIVFTLILLPKDLIKFYSSIIWVIAYLGNIFFWREHGGYFDGGSQEAPLLHTWSLAVEEQYYIVWPLLLFLAYKFFKHQTVIVIAIILSVAATIFSQWGTDVTIGAAYYLLPTRFFELLMGSCLALSWTKLPKVNIPVQHLLSIIGIGLIMGSSIWLNEHSSFPGYNALYPVIGTLLVIFSAQGIVGKFLSLKPMVFTGNISYSLYLWHWPVFVVARYTSVEFTLFNQCALIALTYVLSILSWKYIEQPFRHYKIQSFKNVMTKMYVLPSILLISIAFSGIYFDGYQQRFSSSVVAMDKAVNTFTSKSRELCHSPYRRSERLPDEKCIFGHQDQVDVFIFGDSHANHMVPFVQALAQNANISGQDYTLDRCLPIFDLKWGGSLYLANKCEARNKQAEKYIQTNKFKYVVMSASWPGIQTRRIFENSRVEDNKKKAQLLLEKLRMTLATITNTGAIPVIFKDIPTLGGKSPKCTIKKALYNEQLDCSISYHKNAFFNGLLAELSKEFHSLRVISPHELMCNDVDCQMSISQTPLYRDEDHLNEVGAEFLGKMYIESFGNPFNSAIKEASH